MAEAHAETRKHPYHLVDPSPWPVVGAIAAGMLAAGGVLYMHDIKPFGLPAWIVLPTGSILVLGTMALWWRAVTGEAARHGTVIVLVLTIILGASFTSVQAYEYSHAAFGFKEGIYPSTFFMATGFHGFHVIIGTIFLTVCFFRALKGHFKPDHHFGFEAAAWYWHFVDVVWLFLFICIYWWGSR